MNKQISLPSEREEIHLVTAYGKTAIVCESLDRALYHWRRRGCPVDWKIVRVVTMKDDISPAEMRPSSKSAAIAKFARDRNLPVVDIGLAKVG